MLSLIGVHDCKADAKGRILLPSGLKKQLQEHLSAGFILKKSVFYPCLELYPMVEWNQVMSKINQLNRFVKKNNDFIRIFTAGVRIIEIDTNGRLLIPKDLATYAKINNDLVISATGGIVEVWDKESYEAALNNPEVDFASLAEDVMGNINLSNLE